MNKILTALRNVLQAEPLRMVSYGALVVVWLVTHVAAGKFGLPTIPPDIDGLIVAVGVGAAAVTEFARRWVYAPDTVAKITTGG
jgi:hypothetical protein